MQDKLEDTQTRIRRTCHYIYIVRYEYETSRTRVYQYKWKGSYRYGRHLKGNTEHMPAAHIGLSNLCSFLKEMKHQIALLLKYCIM